MPESSLHSIGQLLAHMRCPTAQRCPLAMHGTCQDYSHAMGLQAPPMSMEDQIDTFSKVIYVGGELHVDVCLGLCMTASSGWWQKLL